jgi:hypothetical protein
MRAAGTGVGVGVGVGVEVGVGVRVGEGVIVGVAVARIVSWLSVLHPSRTRYSNPRGIIF